MTNSDIASILYCRLDGLTITAREEKRYRAIAKLGLLASQGSRAVVEEATQSCSKFLDTPIAIMSIFVDNQQLIKSVVGLENLGFNQELMVKKQILPAESFCIHVVDSLTPLAIENTLTHPFFCQSLLTQHCGVRSYLGVPLITTTGACIGTLAVMALKPRQFTPKDLQFLEILARLTMAQLENIGNKSSNREENPQISSYGLSLQSSQVLQSPPVKIKLLAKLMEELRTPLTAVMGMTGILQQQIYGLLTTKQQEYLEVIRQSGQRMLLRIEEILALDIDNTCSPKISLTMVDLEMLCQQIINNLQEVAKERQQKIHLSIQEDSRLWLSDRRAMRQMIYYLVAVLLDTLPRKSQIKIQIARQQQHLYIRVLSTPVEAIILSSQPYTPDYAPPQLFGTSGLQSPNLQLPANNYNHRRGINNENVNRLESMLELALGDSRDDWKSSPHPEAESWHHLGLLLSCYLAEIHGGKMLRQGSEELGYGYVAILPPLETG